MEAVLAHLLAQSGALTLHTIGNRWSGCWPLQVGCHGSWSLVQAKRISDAVSGRAISVGLDKVFTLQEQCPEAARTHNIDGEESCS